MRRTPRPAHSNPAVPPWAARPIFVPGNLSRLAAATPDDLSALYRTLVDADDRQDALALARLGWVLFTVASTAQQAHRKTAGLLAELQAAASAAYAGAGSQRRWSYCVTSWPSTGGCQSLV
jgi:hypothetical protein